MLEKLPQLIIDDPRLAHRAPNETDLHLASLISIDLFFSGVGVNVLANLVFSVPSGITSVPWERAAVTDLAPRSNRGHHPDIACFRQG
ncbi:hypothetical protein [Nucisporomicrobium flavum]|uniref:hypothetical protein n=1 Tax=Nucisporomicrobium flavum TaxID=2785915 RepID=UPI0018F3C90C|nr:hypothetical protein [Nucisporomicrobium flavum]